MKPCGHTFRHRFPEYAGEPRYLGTATDRRWNACGGRLKVAVIGNKTEGDKAFKSETELCGMVTGSGKVLSGVELKSLGMVCGDLSLEMNSAVELCGTVVGDVESNGGKVSVFGVVQGDAITNSGETAIHEKAIVDGRVVNR